MCLQARRHERGREFGTLTLGVDSRLHSAKQINGWEADSKGLFEVKAAAEQETAPPVRIRLVGDDAASLKVQLVF